ncbi:MAG: hypothetical protein U9N02_06240 [Campylobacterota bacterium]|nr:hypothetical protein [Campylobacterota bacterium]
MHIKKYTVASLILIALVGWYIFAYITQETMSIDFFGIHTPSLSIALWVVLAMSSLYISSLVHMSFYSLLASLKLRKYEKDFEKIIDAIVDAYLAKKDRKHSFKTPRYKLIGSLIDYTTLSPDTELDVNMENEKIKDVIEAINKVKNGEVVDLKKYSLSKSNQLVVQNVKNSYINKNITADEILNNSQKYDTDLCKYIYEDIAKTLPLKSIEKYSSFLSKESLFSILARINSEENILEISNDALIALFDKLELEQKDFIEISRKLSKSMAPDQRMKLFEILSDKNEELIEVYLYTLFDLELLEPADEILRNSQENEYLNFKAYRALKEHNQNFNIDLFIS